MVRLIYLSLALKGLKHNDILCNSDIVFLSDLISEIAFIENFEYIPLQLCCSSNLKQSIIEMKLNNLQATFC